jgi:hypothetical protein
MAITIELDPTAEGTGTVFTISPDSVIGLVSFSAPAPPAKFQWASSVDTEGSALASRGYENRTVTIALEISAAFNYGVLQDKVAKLHREGGTLKYNNDNIAQAMIFDVLATDGFETTFDEAHYLGGIWSVQFSLTCKPFARGAEVDLGDNVETTLPALIFTEATVTGDVPGLGRLVIDNDVASNQAFMIWGIQSRYYSSATTAALFYEAEGRELFGTTAIVTGPATASGGATNNAISQTSLSALRTPMMSLRTTGGTYPTHVGSFHIYARVQAPTANTGQVNVWWEWGIRDDTFLATNPAFPVALENVWLWVDLGMVTIPPPVTGNPRWYGQLCANSTVAGDDLFVDYVMLIPADEGSGMARLDPSFHNDKALFSSQSLEVRHNSVIREDSTGTVWAPVANYYGDYLLVPPSGTEGRTTRVIVKIARLDPFGEYAGGSDASIDDLSARLFVTPRFLVVDT